MRFILPREHKIKSTPDKKGYVIGTLYYTNNDAVSSEGIPETPMERLFNTLEDEWRDYQGGEIKVPGDSCIPSGQYTIKLQHSTHFNRLMPYLQNVPGFDGVMIHWGNDEKDTKGCILVGENTVKGKVTSSKISFNAFMILLEDSGQSEWLITIID